MDGDYYSQLTPGACCLSVLNGCVDTTCLSSLSKYLAPTPLFSSVLLSPNPGRLICTVLYGKFILPFVHTVLCSKSESKLIGSKLNIPCFPSHANVNHLFISTYHRVARLYTVCRDTTDTQYMLTSIKKHLKCNRM